MVQLHLSLTFFVAALLTFAAPAFADDNPPLPMPDDASAVSYDGSSGSLDFNSANSVKDIAAFYRNVAKQQHWTEVPSVINKDNMVVLNFGAGGNEVADITVMRMGEKTKVKIEGMALRVKGDAASKQAAAEEDAPAAAAPAAPAGDVAPLVATDDNGLPEPQGVSSSMNIINGDKDLSFSVPNAVADVVAFYRSELTKKGWKEKSAKVSDAQAELSFTTPEGPARLSVNRSGTESKIQLATGKRAAVVASADEASTALVATEKLGLPLPEGAGNNGSAQTQFSRKVSFSVPNSVAEIVAFYRTELAKKGWKEDSAKMNAKAAELSFTAPVGPAKLTVKRSGDTSDAELTLTEKSKAAASPLAPKHGMVKLIFGNMSDKPADVSIAGKHVKLAAGQGAKGPDGPMLEVKPGKFTAQNTVGDPESFTAGPDEIWMVAVMPVGMMAMKQ